MKQILLVSIVCIFCGKMLAQDDVQLTQFYANKLYYNPAATGSSDKLNASALYRMQWAGSSTISSSDRPNYILVNAAQYFADKRSGVGLTIYNASQHVQQSLQVKASYAYHAQLGNDAWLAFGANLGFMNRSIKEGSTGDGTTINKSYMMSDLGLGLEFYMSDFQTGFAVQHLPVVLGDESMAQHVHWYYYASYVARMGDNWSVIPSAFLRTAQGAAYNFDLSARLSYQNMFQIGAGVRRDAVAILLGFTYNDTFSFGYSFDIYTGGLDGAKPSHEIILSYRTQVFAKSQQDNSLQRMRPTFDY